MRTLTTAQQQTLSGAHYRVSLRVWVEDSGGTLRNLSALGGRDWVDEVQWDEDVDQPVSQVTVRLWREVQNESLAPYKQGSTLNQTAGTYTPLLEAGREIVVEVATTTVGVEPTTGDWEVAFHGEIDEVDWGGSASRISLTARDLGGSLLDRYIETENTYGSQSGMAVEAVMQQILDANLGTGVVTLLTPTSPGWQIKEFKQEKEALLEALRKLAGQIGWDVRYRFSETDGRFRLTFFDPGRAKTTPEWTFGPSRYLDVSTLKTSRAAVRNVVRVVYTDSTDGKRKNLEVRDDASISRFGRRFMELEEDASSLIDTAAEAQQLADSVLTDLRDPKAEQEIELHFFWPAEVGDFYAFSPNGVHYDSEQRWATVGVRHQLSREQQRTTIRVRGSVAGSYRDWLRREVRVTGPAQHDPGIPILAPRVLTTTSGDAADLYVGVDSDAEEHVRLYLRDRDTGPVWVLVRGATDSGVRFAAPGSELGPGDWFHDGTTFAQKLKAVPLLRDQVRRVFLQGEAQNSGAFSTWVPVTLEARAQPWLESVDLTFDEGTDNVTLTAVGGAFCRSARWQFSETADFSTVLQTTDAALADGQRASVSLSAASRRNRTLYGRVTPYNGALSVGAVSGLAGQPQQDSEFVPASESGIQAPTATISYRNDATYPTNQTRESVSLGGALGAGGQGPLQWRYRVDDELSGAGAWQAPATAGSPATADGWSTLALPYAVTQLRGDSWSKEIVLQVRDAAARVGEDLWPVGPSFPGITDTGVVDVGVGHSGGQYIFRRGVDPASDVVESTGRWFVDNGYVDTSRRPHSLLRSTAKEAAENLFKLNSNTLDQVVEGSTYKRTTGTQVTGADRASRALNASDQLATGTANTALVGGTAAQLVGNSAILGNWLEDFDTLPDDWVAAGTTATGSIIGGGVGLTGANVLRADRGYYGRYWPRSIPFDPSKLYRMRGRVRCIHDPGYIDSFGTNTAANYTGGGDVAGSWTIDTTARTLTGDGGTQALYLLNTYRAADVIVEVDANEAADGGVVARYQDNNNYYLLAIRDDTGNTTANLELLKREAGVFTSLGNADVAWPRGTYARVKFQVQGTALTAFFNGTQVLSATDTVIAAAGQVGLRNNGAVGSLFRVRDLWVYTIGEATAKIGAQYVYLGVRSVNATGGTIANVYFAASGQQLRPSQGWVEFTGFLKGTGAGKGNASDPTSPSGIGSTSARFFLPLFLLGWAGSHANGTWEIDYMAVDVLEEEAVLRTYKAVSAGGANLNEIPWRRGGVNFLSTEAFKRGADPASDVVESTGRWFVDNGYVDASRRPHSLLRSTAKEAAENLFKKGTDGFGSIIGQATGAQIQNSAIGDAQISGTSSFAKMVQGRTQTAISGGGTITWTGSALSWTTRFISIPDANSAAKYFDFGPFSNVAVGDWAGLYFRVQIGGAYNHANLAKGAGPVGYFVQPYGTYVPPDPTSGYADYLIGVKNGDNGSFYLWDGRVIPAGKSIVGGFSLPEGTVDDGKIGGGRSLANSDQVNADRRIVNVYRGTGNEAVTMLFKRQADPAADVVETGGLSFASSAYLDARRPNSLLRSTLRELAENLFKKGTDTVDSVVNAESLAGAQAKASASTSLGNFHLNPTFSNWPAGASHPTGWANWVGGNDTPARETSLTRGGSASAMRFNVAAGVEVLPYTQIGTSAINRISHLYVEVEIYLESGSISGAGVHVQIWNTANNAALGVDTNVPFSSQLGLNPTTGRWYTVRKVLRMPDSEDRGNIKAYAMANWSGFGETVAAKNIVFGRYVVRPATDQEVSAYNAINAGGTSLKEIPWTRGGATFPSTEAFKKGADTLDSVGDTSTWAKVRTFHLNGGEIRSVSRTGQQQESVDNLFKKGADGFGSITGQAAGSQIQNNAIGDAQISGASSFAKMVQGRTQTAISGGGTITWTGSALSWTTRLISIPDANSADRYFDFGPFSGIGVGDWAGLYFRVQIGGGANHANGAKGAGAVGYFVQIYYQYVPPDPTSGYADYLIGVKNGDNGSFYLWDGRVIPAGTSILGGLSLPEGTVNDGKIGGGRSLTNSDQVNGDRRIVNVYRGIGNEPVTMLFKRQADPAADVVETGGLSFASSDYLDARRPIALLRSTLRELAENLFKINSNTLDHVLDGGTYGLITKTQRSRFDLRDRQVFDLMARGGSLSAHGVGSGTENGVFARILFGRAAWNSMGGANPTSKELFDRWFDPAYAVPIGTSLLDNINWTSASQINSPETDYIAVEHVFWFQPAYSGNHWFGVSSDDGCELELNGTVISAHYGGRGASTAGPQNAAGPYNLDANGFYSFVLRMQEGAGGEGCIFWYSSDGANYSVVPRERLHRPKVRVSDQRRINNLIVANKSSSTTSGGYLGGWDDGWAARIDVGSFTLQYGFGQVSYNSGSITGLSYSTRYFVYCDDPDFAGGSRTYYATQSFVNVVNRDGRIFVGECTTPASGGGGTSGGGGGGCVALDSWLREGLLARDATEGDLLDAWVEGSERETFRTPIQTAYPAKTVACVRITSERGAALVVGRDTPIVLRSGAEIRAEHADGERLLVDVEGDLRWEGVTVEDAGFREVRYFNIGGGVYAAGERPHARIYTHNVIAVKE